MIGGIQSASGLSAHPSPSRVGGKAGEGPDGLTEEQRKAVEQLRRRDTEVRAHEQTHQSVGGQYAGSPSYQYQKGPDGQRYAVGGEVPIDVSPEADPRKTIAKMEVVKRAALAPAEPSPQDRKVAALAARQQADAQIRLLELSAAEREAQGAEREAGDAQARADGAGHAAGAGTADRQADAASRRAAQAYERAAALGPTDSRPRAMA